MGVNAARVMGMNYGRVIVTIVHGIVVTVMHMIENAGITNYTLNSVRGHASTLALGVQANSAVGPEMRSVKVVVNVSVRATNATRVVHFHAHRRPLLLAGLARRWLRVFAAARAFSVHLEFRRPLCHLKNTPKQLWVSKGN